MLHSLIALLLVTFGANPVEYGEARLSASLHAAGLDARRSDIQVLVSPSPDPECYTITAAQGRVRIQGSDAAGAMYGALALAEQLDLRGAPALDSTRLSGRPFVSDRGLNVFLTLPWDYQQNQTDYDPKALTDPERWWFQNDDYWSTLLDLMADARLNWLDLHGAWDIAVTDAPNLYAYFIQCPDFPDVGVQPDIKAANLARLNRVIEMAHARGVRVSLMAYEARLGIPQNRTPPYPNNEDTAYRYTAQAVEGMIRSAPGLDAIGFRIGESGHGAEFFTCYTQAIKRSQRDIPLITRSWITRRATVLPLARASTDFTVEIKYNGEQWGPPYPVVGGRVAGWYSYSFEDYLSDPGPAPAARLWSGNPLPGGASWPAQPFKIVWQVRLNGTHRIFPIYDPDWIRRSIGAMKLGTARGFTIEPMNAYFPASPRYYLANPGDEWCRWIHQRDELFLKAWGRLGYEPQLSPEILELPARQHFGAQSSKILRAWQAASRVVPAAFTAFSLGPDHRDHAPELEWGGDTRSFVEREPFDTHAFMSVKEMAALRATGGKDGRLTPLDAAAILESLSRDCQQVADIKIDEVPPAARGHAFELSHSIAMCSYLADYYAARFRAAEAASRSMGSPGAGAASEAGYWMQRALAAWTGLSESPHAAFYRPFTDRLRMKTNDFHWRTQLPAVRAEAAKFPNPSPTAPTPVAPPESSPLPEMSWTQQQDAVVCSVPARGLAAAWLLHKPLPSSTFFHKIPMSREGEFFSARIPRLPAGHLLAAEVETAGTIRRIPSWEPGPPYIVVPSLSGPTPTYFSSEQSLEYLDPHVLTTDRYSMLLICTRAQNFHRFASTRQQRKLLDAVDRGLPLLVLQQDYLSDRYPLKWLGADAPKVGAFRSDEFDPAHALSLDSFQAPDLLTQHFLPTPGWDIPGNGAIAHTTRGKGEIWMTQARLMQRMDSPPCAAALLKLLSLKGTDKPVVVVDAGTEGGPFATSVFTDFLNAHSIPFLTLGEVIAAEQGPGPLAPLAGPLNPDDLLEGRGAAMLKDDLVARVKAAAHRSPPQTLAEFDTRRAQQRADLLKSLDLDPPPPRTPLNARVTGVLKRTGYRIEKLVFESRPRFYVTALLYVPDAPVGTRFPVIVNPHGHWPHKKMEPVVQARAVFQALHGYMAVVVDSPGYSYEGTATFERRGQGPHNDWSLTLASGSATGIYVWDLMRTVDYLESRDDTDTTRLGITGTSGGGLATTYAFAADPRFAAAVPVCYATSMEINPNNGCLCNHVPGMLRIGDRADVLALRAPAPVLVLGAQKDAEFPPEGTRLTGEKLKALYSVCNAAQNTVWRLFDSGHDYNRPMREAMIGFFDLHLRHIGDGSPVPEPQLTLEPPDSGDLVCLNPVPDDQITMQDIARERLALAHPHSFDEVVERFGGRPAPIDPQPQILETRDDGITLAFYRSERALKIPIIIQSPPGPARAAVVLVCDDGKSSTQRLFNVNKLLESGFICASIDARGCGELAPLDPRLLAYLGTPQSFTMGWDAAQAVLALHRLPGSAAVPQDTPIGVAGRGFASSQAAIFAALLAPQDVSFVASLDGPRTYADCFAKGVPASAIMFDAAHSAPLEHLRSLVRQPSSWQFRDDPDPKSGLSLREPDAYVLKAFASMPK